MCSWHDWHDWLFRVVRTRLPILSGDTVQVFTADYGNDGVSLCRAGNWSLRVCTVSPDKTDFVNILLLMKREKP